MKRLSIYKESDQSKIYLYIDKPDMIADPIASYIFSGFANTIYKISL